IEALVAAGVDVFRLNFSHGSHQEHGERVRRIREAASNLGTFVAVLADLQGPKIRIRGFDGAESVELVNGASFTIDGQLGEREGNIGRVGTSYQTLAEDVEPGDVLVLGDGLIELA